MSLKDVQRRLTGLGYPVGTADGLWGPRTEAAVTAVIDKTHPAPPQVPEAVQQKFPLLGSDKLIGVHRDLVKVIQLASELCPFQMKITEGLRTLTRQKQLFAAGATTTLNSRHLTGHAIDVVPMFDMNEDGKISTEEMYAWPMYYKMADHIKEAALQLNVVVDWGGDWKSFKDGPHWELDWGAYPK